MGGWLKKELHNLGTGVVHTAQDLPGSLKGFVNNPLQSVEKYLGGYFNAESFGSLHGATGASMKDIGGAAAATMAALYGGSLLSGGGAAGGAGGASSNYGVLGSSTDYFGTPILPAGTPDYLGAGYDVFGNPVAGAGAGAFGGGGGGFSPFMTSGGAGGSSMLRDIGGGLSIFSGLYGLYNAHQMQQMAKRADPFAAYRGDYAAELAKLEANPSSITSTPGWDAGIQAVQRGMASKGMGLSGNEEIALMKYGGDFFNQREKMLADLAGANINPMTTAQIYQMGTNTASQSLGSLGYGATMLSGWNPNMMYAGGYNG